MTVEKIIIRTIQGCFNFNNSPPSSKTAAENHQRIKIGVKIFALFSTLKPVSTMIVTQKE